MCGMYSVGTRSPVQAKWTLMTEIVRQRNCVDEPPRQVISDTKVVLERIQRAERRATDATAAESRDRGTS